MKIPVFPIIVLTFIIWLNYEIRKNNRNSKHDMDNFWQREKEANFSRRKDLSELNYITISTDMLPLIDNPDPTTNSYRDILLKLSGKTAINLRGHTNTDLKIKYGAANINQLMEYESNYITLVSILQKWANHLYNQGKITDCQSILEFALSYQTDVTKSYTMLANIYKSQNRTDNIKDLIETIANTPIQNKDRLIKELENINNS